MTLQKWLENKTLEGFLSWLTSKNNFCVVTELDARVNGVGLVNRDAEILLCYVLIVRVAISEAPSS